MKALINTMGNFKKKLLKNDVYFLLINFYIILLVLIPKSISSIFSFVPLRLLLSLLLLLFLTIELLKKKLPLNKFNVKLLLLLFSFFIVFSIPSLFLTKNLINSLYTLSKFIVFFILLLFLLKINFTKKQYSQLLLTFIFTTFIVLLYSVIEYFLLPNLFAIGIEKYPGARGRASSTFFNTIYFGMYINLLAAYFLYLYVKSEKTINICFLYLLNVLMYLCILLTFTRSSLLVYFGILFLLIIFLNIFLSKKRFLGFLITITFVSIIFPGSKSLFRNSFEDGYTFIASYIEKFTPIDLPDFKSIFKQSKPNLPTEPTSSTKPTTPTKPPKPTKPITPIEPGGQEDDPSLIHRKEFSKIASRIIKDNVLTGIGIGSYIDYMRSEDFNQKYPDYQFSKTHPHSGIILMASEVGVISTFIFFSFIIFLNIKALLNAFQSKKKINEKYYISIISFIVILGFLIVNIIAENSIYDTQIFPLFLIIAGLSLNYSDKRH